MSVRIFGFVVFILLVAGCGKTTELNSSGENSVSSDQNEEVQSGIESTSIPPRIMKFTSAGGLEMTGTYYKSGVANSPVALMLLDFLKKSLK